MRRHSRALPSRALLSRALLSTVLLVTVLLVPVLLVTVLGALPVAVHIAGHDLTAQAQADVVTASTDTLRTGWDSHEPALSPGAVGAPDFGQLFATQLRGQVYAQPIIARGTLLAVTEADVAYGLDPTTGAIIWHRRLGRAWPASAIGCGDLAPSIGATATPVYDPGTGTAYFTTEIDDGPDVDHPHWYVQALDITTGAERANFPAMIAGAPGNDPTHPFNAKQEMQRPGLLLLGGVVYAGFGSHCDFGTYRGYVVGVDASSGVQTAMWSTQVGTTSKGSGLWQAGGGLVSDGAGTIIVSTGNGVSPPPGPGSAPPANLGESVIRLRVRGDGSLAATDFFSPVNNSRLDTDDRDLGSGSPTAIPDGYGTSAHPHLLVQVGKDGRVFLLDRDHLGGTAQGPPEQAGGDPTDDVLQTVGPNRGVWGGPGFWGGDGGWVYLVESNGPLRAYKLSTSGAGLPSLTAQGVSSGTWGFSSGSPVVTSDGTTAGTGLVWAVHSDGSSGANGQLRAYDTVPVDGVMNLRWSAPIGTASKFTRPATDGGRVYVGTRDGRVYGFGHPSTAALTGTYTNFGRVPVNTTGSQQVTLTAASTGTAPVTVTEVRAPDPFSLPSASDPPLPATLQPGDTITGDVVFAPTTTGEVSAALTVIFTQAGVQHSVQFAVVGSGSAPGVRASPSSIDFGTVPTSATSTLGTTIANTGDDNETITSVTPLRPPFESSALPVGTVIAPGGSVSVALSYDPTAAGSSSGTFTVDTTHGTASVAVTATGVIGAPLLRVTPERIDFGRVMVGDTPFATFAVRNVGNIQVLISKAAPPTAPFVVAHPLSEGQPIGPRGRIAQTVGFAPTALGRFTADYTITGNDGTGPHLVVMIGVAVAPRIAVAAPAGRGSLPSQWHVNGAASIAAGRASSAPHAAVLLTPATAGVTGSVVRRGFLPTEGLTARFTAVVGRRGDGVAFALLDPAASSPRSLGLGRAGSLGFGGLHGVAVTLDTRTRTLGIARGTGARGVLHYAAVLRLGGLSAGPHVFDVSVTGSTITVRLDSRAPLAARVHIGARARLAFTGSTSTVFDRQTVRDVTIVARAPVG